MSSDEIVFYPHGSLEEDGDPVAISPQRAGWRYTGLRVLHLEPGQDRTIRTGTMEAAVVPLAGSFVVECDGQRFSLDGRDDVFSRVTDFAYVPRDAEVLISSSGGGDIALPMAEAERRFEPRYGPAEEVPVEVRGAGQATRQITNFLEPSAFPADRLIAVEVLTPAGNWSSYPPHKHDEEREGESVNEEVYYFRISRPEGFALHHLYTSDGEINATEKVRDGDVFLIPRGYHGPSVAPPGYELYYLNVLAGPRRGEERSMANCLDPSHAWVVDTWADAEPDGRLPMTGAGGRR